MATYASLRATAQRLIQKNGRNITYKQPSVTLQDANNPQLGVIATTIDTPNVKAAFIQDTVTRLTQTIVQVGDKICLIAADDLPGIDPDAAEDKILDDDGTEYSIISAESIDPSEAPIVYQFILRA